MKTALKVSNLTAKVTDSSILNNLNFFVQPGSVHAIMGPNGSGKSSFAHVLMGHPAYEQTGGSVFLYGQNITDFSVDKRAQAGLFLAVQQPLAIAGLKVFTFLKESYQAVMGTTIEFDAFKELLDKKMSVLNMDPLFAQRNVNEGFSGGEKKRLEMLQLLLLQPKVAILDEIDSGLDIDALQCVAHGLQQVRKDNPGMAIIIITHYQRILHYIQPDEVHILVDGAIVQSGSAQLVNVIEQQGYEQYCAR